MLWFPRHARQLSSAHVVNDMGIYQRHDRLSIDFLYEGLSAGKSLPDLWDTMPLSLLEARVGALGWQLTAVPGHI